MPSQPQPSSPNEPTNIIPMPAPDGVEQSDFSAPENFINRELS